MSPVTSDTPHRSSVGLLRVIPPLLLLCALSSCEGTNGDSADTPGKHKVLAAVANLQPTAGSSVVGEVRFTAEPGGGVRVEAEVRGLEGEQHGFHVHEHGDCSAPDGSSAGGHFDPLGAPHGSPVADDSHRHVGDLGNLAADPTTGIAKYDRLDPLLSLDGERSIVGKAVIVHAGADDLTTQPTGGAGARVACGVIVAGRATDGS